MLEFYHKLALKLDKVSWLLWLGLAGSVVFCGYALLLERDRVSGDQELAVVVPALWFFSMIAMKSWFIEITPRPRDDERFFTRLGKKAKRAFSGLIALVFSGITLAVVFLTYRAIMFWV